SKESGGWIGLDPTSGLLAGEGHIPLACNADPSDAAAISGSLSPEDVPEGVTIEVASDMKFTMTVERIYEDPRVTKPYTPQQWDDILRLGYEIDRDLAAHDVRLTMGGEPTFVSIDDKDGGEWNTEAVGPTKRRFADKLLKRLQNRFAPEGLQFHGQGKWYPGESLPRWAFALHWRKDGVPLWTHPDLFANEEQKYGYGSAQAKAFIYELASRLEVDAESIQPGYEDAWYYMWREQSLPVNVDPLKSKLDDKQERDRIARIFDQGLNEIVGYSLPLRRERIDGQPRWQSARWKLRREHLFLVPGDSPMGFRLPLDSLPWAPPEVKHKVIEDDPWKPRGPLPGNAESKSRIRHQTPNQPNEAGPRDASADPVIRTTLCVEARDGRMHVFLPPQPNVEDFLDLIAAIEATAVELNLPIYLEGYPPPFDPRMEHMKITPDPGVIEVNIHPASDWHELVHSTTVLYEEARLARLCTEKFQLDGKHTGTLGGNHMVLGGPTPADSPILRRPDLLRSLVAYWHNHPSLSYLFSGLFMGPTSQAPRLDEARNDSVYEMEIAFEQIPKDGGYCPPWMVDRIFRHLLTDLTGNTHRAEFCIDKLYSPDSATGRLGLVEFRGFEMPPHHHMSLVQQLFLRTLIARFWNRPYRQGLVRWGTELHDKFMLPHFIKQDFHDIITELRQEGYPLDERWFDPHYEFRFPHMGELAKLGLHLELRQAIEPWHVLGEEATGTGTARYVDSSLERVQVKLSGMTNGRHILAVNGRRVPLHPTGTNGEFVAGVRFRAWQPPSCLHPTIGIHSPLVFDLYDTWLNRAIAGCTYHVVHPGGRSYETFPVNANEAEGRRINRFFVLGHSPARYLIPMEERSPETPLTLDLRMPPIPPFKLAATADKPHRPGSNGKGASTLECLAPS
ncbi:MAG: transglutaminase family protein, partial [Planctomycetota bacterium]